MQDFSTETEVRGGQRREEVGRSHWPQLIGQWNLHADFYQHPDHPTTSHLSKDKQNSLEEQRRCTPCIPPNLCPATSEIEADTVAKNVQLTRDFCFLKYNFTDIVMAKRKGHWRRKRDRQSDYASRSQLSWDASINQCCSYHPYLTRSASSRSSVFVLVSKLFKIVSNLPTRHEMHTPLALAAHSSNPK